PLHGRQRAAEAEPVRDRDVTLRDREEAREARFGRQQVVAAGIETAVGHSIPDREELAHRIEEEPEVHLGDPGARLLGERGETALERPRLDEGEIARMALDTGAE